METMKTFKTFSRRSEQRRFRGGFETVSRRFEQRRFQDVLKRSRKKRKEKKKKKKKKKCKRLVQENLEVTVRKMSRGARGGGEIKGPLRFLACCL